MLLGNNKIRGDIWNEALDEKLAPSLGGVELGLEDKIYTDPNEFFVRTLITENMMGILENLVLALSGEGGVKIQVLGSLFGGGKTHLMIAILHALNKPSALKLAKAENKEVEKRLEVLVKRLEGLGRLEIVVVDGSFAKLAPSPIEPLDAGGYKVRTLWGYLAHVLGSYSIMREHDEKLTAPDASRLFDLLKDRKVVLLVDEVAQYVKRFYESAAQDLKLYASAVLTFFENLAKAVGTAEKVSLIVTLPAEKIEGELKVDRVYISVRDTVEGIFRVLNRVGAYFVEPVAPRSVPALLKVRLFEEVDKGEAKRISEQLRRVYSENKEVFGEVGLELVSKVLDTYPFHPEYVSTLLDILDKHEGLQRTRDLLKISRKVLRDVQQDERRKYALVMPWHIDVTRDPLRSALLSGTYEGFKTTVDTDVVERCNLYEKPWLARVAALTLFVKVFAYGGRLVPEARPYPTPSELAVAVYEPVSFAGESLAPKNLAEAISWISQNLTYIAVDERTGRLWFINYPTPVRLVEERARVIDDETAFDILVDKIEGLLEKRKRKGERGLFSLALVQRWYEPLDVDKREYFVVVCLKKPPQEELEKIVYEVRSGGTRRYANTVYVVYPSSSEKLQFAVKLAKLYKACEEVKSMLKEYIGGFSEEEREIALNVMSEKLDRYKSNVEENFSRAVLSALDTIAYPVYDKQSSRNTVKEEFLTQADDILFAVEKTLLDPRIGKVKRELDYEILNYYLLRNLGINLSEGEPRKVSDLVDYFYSNPVLPAVPRDEVLNALTDGLRGLHIGLRCGDRVLFKKVIPCGESEECLRELPDRAEGQAVKVEEGCVVLPWMEALKAQMQRLKRRETVEDGVPVIIDYVVKIDGELKTVEEVLQNLDRYDLEKLRLAPVAERRRRIMVETRLEPAEVVCSPGDSVDVRAELSGLGPFEGEVLLEPSEGRVSRQSVYVKPGITEEVVWTLKAPEKGGVHSFVLTVKDDSGRVLGSATLTLRVREVVKGLGWVPRVPSPGARFGGLRVRLEKPNFRPLSILRNRLGGDAVASEMRLSLKVRDIVGRPSSIDLRAEGITLDDALSLVATPAHRFQQRIEEFRLEMTLVSPSERPLTFPDIPEAERRELEGCLEYLPVEGEG